MLTGLIRPVETRTINVEGDSLADIHEKLTAQIPAGWELTKAPVAMQAGSTALKATGTFERRDGTREIEADTMTRPRPFEWWSFASLR